MNIILTSFVELFFFPFHKCLVGTATLKNVICPLPGMAGSLCHLGRKKKKKHGDFICLATCGYAGGVIEENKSKKYIYNFYTYKNYIYIKNIF